MATIAQTPSSAGSLLLRSLTSGEAQVLVLVCAGLTNVRIAERMNTTEQVVKNYMRDILRKAQRHNRCELVIFAFRNGVVECPCRKSPPKLGSAAGWDSEINLVGS
jgi:DNA-binding NarL/FixJ family response regulator